jgi:prepilin-type N-terminal cleavage/methylation domain-containing protein
MQTHQNKLKGFTLLEMILVLVIMSSILLLITNYATQRMAQYRRDRAAMQMQQILNAGLNYYVNTGGWPLATCGTAVVLSLNNSLLQTASYLPSTIPSPFGGSTYSINCTTTGVFQVILGGLTQADAQILQGELPIATLSSASSVYTVTAQVQVPGQDLNNARSVNFSGIYRHGACVPVPSCPTGMTAQISVAPAAVAGVYDAPTTAAGSTTACSTTAASAGTDCNSINSYPITSFSAYATGGPASTPTSGGDTAGGPPACDGASTSTALCYQSAAISGTSFTWTPVADGSYWRVCLSVSTEKGPVTIPNTNWGNTTNTQFMYWTEALGSIMVTTRCSGNTETSGSYFSAYGH